MNYIALCGRLTSDPKSTEKVTKYSLAVDRNGDGTDFINCVCFGKQSEFATNYLHKGMKILVEGRLQTGSYTNKDGVKIPTADVIVSRHEFVESKASGNATPDISSFVNIPVDIEEELPFE